MLWWLSPVNAERVPKMADKFLIVKWLLANTSVLKELATIVAKWADSLSLAEKLDIVYQVCKALLPVIESFPLFQAQGLGEMTEEEAQKDLATVQSLGIALPILLNVIAPIVTTLVNLIIARRNGDQ